MSLRSKNIIEITMNPNVSSTFSVKLFSIFPDFLNINFSWLKIKLPDLEEWTDSRQRGISLLNKTMNDWSGDWFKYQHGHCIVHSQVIIPTGLVELPQLSLQSIILLFKKVPRWTGQYKLDPFVLYVKPLITVSTNSYLVQSFPMVNKDKLLSVRCWKQVCGLVHLLCV